MARKKKPRVKGGTYREYAKSEPTKEQRAIYRTPVPGPIIEAGTGGLRSLGLRGARGIGLAASRKGVKGKRNLKTMTGFQWRKGEAQKAAKATTRSGAAKKSLKRKRMRTREQKQADKRLKKAIDRQSKRKPTKKEVGGDYNVERPPVPSGAEGRLTRVDPKRGRTVNPQWKRGEKVVDRLAKKAGYKKPRPVTGKGPGLKPARRTTPDKTVSEPRPVGSKKDTRGTDYGGPGFPEYQRRMGWPTSSEHMLKQPGVRKRISGPGKVVSEGKLKNPRGKRRPLRSDRERRARQQAAERKRLDDERIKSGRLSEREWGEIR